MIELWGEAVRSIEPKVKPAHRDLWLRPIECLGIVEGRIRLRAPNRYHKEWFEDNFLPSILDDLETRVQTRFSVDFELETAGDEDSIPLMTGIGSQLSMAGSMSTVLAHMQTMQGGPDFAEEPRAQVEAPPRSLDSRYTFDKFVVGPTNQFAHAAARMVAETPASKWNPLFVYGGVGLGKTHLLHAVGREIWRQHPDWKIVCVTCERFVTEFIGAIRDNSGKRGGGSLMEQFRHKYREEPDVLLIDDIQFLSNKDSSQDEFFHTFNALHHSHKQIVLTCDKLPGELPGLEDRLRSRFTWGLIAEIGQPDLETRVAILKRKAESENLILPDDVALYLGAHVKSNVRELEGALTRLCARASIEGRTITRELAEEALRNFLPSTPPSLTIEAIQREVASYFGVKLHDLKGPKRHRAVAHPRMVAMYLARRLTSMSYPEIGSRFGGKDHSTVISAVRKIERLCGTDPAQRSVINTLESHLRQV
jgi:chromosomal replication initiator protein